MRWLFAIALICTLGFTNYPVSEHTQNLLEHSIVLDTHVDTTQRLVWDHFDLAHRDKAGSIDIPRMRQGDLNAVFFSIWIPGKITGQAAVQQALAQIAAVHRQVRLHDNDLAFCTTAEDIKAAHTQGKIAILMGMEGGHMINNSLDMLQKYAKLGVRYMTLTHSLNTDWADSSSDIPKHNGLTDFGKQVVLEMNRLGMMVDISHVSDKTFYDALSISQAPMIASHSSCRAICSAPRNMTDDMIKALAAKGGVIQINYYDAFLDQKFYDTERQSKEILAMEAQKEKQCGANQACGLLSGSALTHKLVAQGKLPKVSWKEIIQHIDHVVKLVGVDHVGLGSDFDGASMPTGMEDASHIPQIAQALLDHGYSEADVQKILGGNILRVMQAVQATAEKLKS